jgi:hypothetical protein
LYGSLYNYFYRKVYDLLCPLWFPLTNYKYERDWRKYIKNIYYWLRKRKKNVNKRCNITTFVSFYIKNIYWYISINCFLREYLSNINQPRYFLMKKWKSYTHIYLSLIRVVGARDWVGCRIRCMEIWDWKEKICSKSRNLRRQTMVMS